ncbi:uncharacterized protein E0L32_003969 [Thyridium curvatum]|uniref:Structure-specific endonuclease subunit SLX4 n=1 Tax=Thyridium curvatum TaxID=1093900 RepID=A0A507BIA7_9PEZI|nr:uncharacterized protein E0L32_003969 [Thyridium curvatum]TPX16320.1 hypothetical protein E0L32_003969 [Thyridium curvatum]
MPSSSPDLPTLSDLSQRFPKKGPLRTGSRAAPLPADAPSTFTTAAQLWRATQLEHDLPAPAAQGPVPETKPPPRRRKAAPKDKDVAEKPKPRRKPRKQIPKAVVELSPDTSRSEAHAPEPVETAQQTPPRPKNIAVIEISSPLSDKPWRKFMASKSPSVGERSPSKDDSSQHAASDLSEMTTSESVSKYFASPSKKKNKTNEVQEMGSTDEPPIILESALRRRTDWTPPPEDTVVIASDPAAFVEVLTQDQNPYKDPANDIFGSLRTNFGYLEEPALPSVEAPVDDAPRPKVLDMIQIQEDPKQPEEQSMPPPKKKAAKKKARTITELATAAYAARTDDEEAVAVEKPKPDSLLNYFPVDDEEICYNPGHPVAQLRKGVKGASKTRKKKGEPTRRNVLLSPTSAMRQSTRQDFVFGTSSQLAREESPTLIRELQVAIAASNAVDEEQPCDSLLMARTGAKSRLWAAGARGADGDLHEPEVIDLIDSPGFPEDPLARLTEKPHGAEVVPLHDCLSEPLVEPSPTKNPAVIIDLLDSPCIPVPQGKGLAQLPNGAPTTSATPSRFTVNGLAGAISSPSVAKRIDPPPRSPSPDEMPPPSNQQALVSPPKRKGKASATAAASTARPKYELFTDAQLSKEVKNYGFKVVKKRSAMIALLDQCWTSRHGGSALGTSVQSMAISTTASAAAPRGKKAAEVTAATTATTSPARPRGRPRKDKAAVEAAAPSETTDGAAPQPAKKRARSKKDTAVTTSTTTAARKAVEGVAVTPKRRKAAASDLPATAVEIADSDLDDPFSTPVSASDHVFSSPSGVDISVSEDAADMSLATSSPTNQQAALFGFITRAVTTAPPTTDPRNPSWHEKMLLYDPIILEDLAAWLNSGELDRVGYDGEVSAEEVKQWCESKSVCCLWRISIHGKERKRF